VGTRLFGYVPMGGELLVTPQRVEGRTVQDGTAHRLELPAPYNTYRHAEPHGLDDATMLLQPLFITSVLLARSLQGASRVLLSSASSKTALGTAYLLRRAGSEVAGITASVSLVSTLDVYDHVVGYDEVEALEERPTTFVDLAGDGRLRAAVQRHLGEALEETVLVGLTHAHAADEAEPGIGRGATFFFAPDHLREGVDAEALAAFRELLAWSAGWLVVERHDGPEAVVAAWESAVAGALPPQTGLSLAL
jgi:hypothetical protein